jgi:hypothetical protein
MFSVYTFTAIFSPSGAVDFRRLNWLGLNLHGKLDRSGGIF